MKKFKSEGFKVDEYKFYGEIKRVMTTYESFSNFVSIDMSFGKCFLNLIYFNFEPNKEKILNIHFLYIVRELPESTSVLILHGTNDEASL